LIENMFVILGGRVFQQTLGIPMGTNFAPLLADLFLYSYETKSNVLMLLQEERGPDLSSSSESTSNSYHLSSS
jgi:hypothetical protein